MFKCFIPQSWQYSNRNAVQGFLHPEGVYDDPKGGTLRTQLYHRLKYHFQFQNAYILFPIAHRAKYSINIFGQYTNKPIFYNISNLFLVKTIDTCFDHHGQGKVEGIKNDDNQWNIQGHEKRILLTSCTYRVNS